MATKEIISINSLLYGSRNSFTIWPDAHVGMQSKPNVVSQVHRAQVPRTLKSKVSTLGFALEKYLDKKVSVCTVKDQPLTYVEYTHKSGEVDQVLIQVDGQDIFIVASSDTTSGTVTLTAILMALLCNEKTQSLWKNNADILELCSYCTQNPMDEDTMFLACDCFYYGFAKNRNAEIETDAPKLQLEINRIQQNNLFEHCPDTAAPALIQLKKENKSNKKVKEQPALFTEPLDTFFQRCQNGEFIIDYQWSDKQKGYIVPLNFLDTFIPTETFRLMLLSVWYQIQNVLKKMKKGVSYNEIMGKNPINIKIMGKPGTGKTTVIEAVLASLGYPKGLITCKDRMEEDEIEGQSKFINGTVYNIPTKAGELHSVGGAIVLEEFNLPDPGILQGSLGQALAYPFILKVDGYKEYVRHPLTIYFATMNIGTCGSKPMNEALSSRFAEGFILEDVPDEEFIKILNGAGYKKGDCKKVFSTYKKILNYLREYHEELVLAITLRHCLNALDKISIGFTEEQAYDNTFISQLYSSDPEVAKDLKSVLKMA